MVMFVIYNKCELRFVKVIIIQLDSAKHLLIQIFIVAIPILYYLKLCSLLLKQYNNMILDCISRLW